METVIMPQVGQDIPSAIIVEWKKQENEPVEKGEILLVVESDKAAFEVEAENAGILLKILHQEGEEVDVFSPVAYIGEPGESFETAEAKETDPASREESITRPTSEETPKMTAGETGLDRRFASPSARRTAREHGVDLTGVVGSGPQGRIIQRDVLTSVPSPRVSGEQIAKKERAEKGTVVPFSRMRQRIAERLALSSNTIPHFHLMIDIDMTDTLGWRNRINTEETSKVSITDLIVKACALGLREFPVLNSHVEKDRIILKNDIHIGLATAVEDGLVVPVIEHADTRSLRELSEVSKEKTASARKGFLNTEPAATFTITSLGMYSIQRFVPVINPPECAILAVGAVEKRVVPVDGAIGIRDMMSVTLACDHRAVDGVYAAEFLNRFRQYLETDFVQLQ